MPRTLKIANSVRANETVGVVNCAKGPKERADGTWKRRANMERNDRVRKQSRNRGKKSCGSNDKEEDSHRAQNL